MASGLHFTRLSAVKVRILTTSEQENKRHSAELQRGCSFLDLAKAQAGHNLQWACCHAQPFFARLLGRTMVHVDIDFMNFIAAQGCQEGLHYLPKTAARPALL